MAVARTAASPAAEQTSEREYQATLNRAVQDTEQEIFGEALGDDPLDNDGDTSLEDMGEGLEGEETDEEAEPDEGAEEAEEDESEADPEAETHTGEAEEEVEEPVAAQPRDGRQQANIPPAILRQSNDRARQAEDRAQALERQLSEVNGRLSELSARVNAPPPRQEPQKQPKPPMPDQFAEPDKWAARMREDVLEEASAIVQTRMAEFETSQRQLQQQQHAERMEVSLQMASRGERRFDFKMAYGDLAANAQNPQYQQVLNGIRNSPDPGQAILNWWDENGGPEYREYIGQLNPQPQRQERQQQVQPRQVFRPGQRLPSLNSATGSNRQQVANPEMLDGSEASIFGFASRR